MEPHPQYLLVETPYGSWPLDLADRVFRLSVGGITAVIAHPERNRDVQAKPELLEPVVKVGGLVQLTAGSLDGRERRGARACAAELLDRGLAHLIASDGHTPDVRLIGMSDAVDTLDDEQLAHWLTAGVPGAIVSGETLPPRPQRRPRRRRSLFRR